MTASRLVLTGHDLSLDDLARFEHARPVVSLAEEARKRMHRSVAAVAKAIAAGRASYGINTGFGAFARTRISADQVVQLQYNLIRSHACGVGEPLAPPLVRRLMVLKANSLAVGYSGVRPEVVDTLLALLNADVLPVIPAKGSVGASGDLAPLAHLTLALIGEGEAMRRGELLRGEAVLAAAGLKPLQLAAKEGLALLNGTQLSAALAIEGLLRARNLLATAIVSGAFAVEALAGSYSPFDARIHDARNLPGQQRAAAAFRHLLTESEIHKSHADCDRVQDPYALRCMPQVFGAVLDTLAHAAGVLERECNAVSDNPLIFDDDVLSGGNFHAEPLAFVADFMTIATAELGSIAERRIDLMLRKVNPALPMFLTREPGLESGFMIAHVTAAALASENKTLAHPASVDSLPTSAGQEDHVSMAPWAGLKLLAVCDNVARILAIELMACAAALDAQRPLKTTPELERVYELVRECVPPHAGDRRLDLDIANLTAAIESGRFAALLPGGSDLFSA
ncbi:MAG TPA: histidine ammonia-lyase [Gammaproteobacteria bacterium]|nr:histidine ammonia-lyase [Gammaproteobacteria bacterium]